MSLNRMILCSKLKNGLCKVVTKSQVVTKFNVTKSRLHCAKQYFIQVCTNFTTQLTLWVTFLMICKNITVFQDYFLQKISTKLLCAVSPYILDILFLHLFTFYISKITKIEKVLLFQDGATLYFSKVFMHFSNTTCRTNIYLLKLRFRI